MTGAVHSHGDLSPDAFRTVMARFATGVAVVTCVQGSSDHAMTANSFTSVSLSPPLVLFCVENESRFHEAVVDSGTWSVNILDSSQAGRARWFATRGRPLVGQFDTTPTHRSPVSGALHLDTAIATLDCRTSAVHVAGDHDIVVGEVLDLRVLGPESEPLVYYRSRFRALAPEGDTRP
jgi:flavin reductase